MFSTGNLGGRCSPTQFQPLIICIPKHHLRICPSKGPPNCWVCGCKFLVILLMVQKSGNDHLECIKPCKKLVKLPINWLAGSLPSTVPYYNWGDERRVSPVVSKYHVQWGPHTPYCRLFFQKNGLFIFSQLPCGMKPHIFSMTNNITPSYAMSTNMIMVSGRIIATSHDVTLK